MKIAISSDSTCAISQNEANKLGIKLANSVDTVKTGTIDTTVETVNRTIETVKPYAEQAKKGLNIFGGIVKNKDRDEKSACCMVVFMFLPH